MGQAFNLLILGSSSASPTADRNVSGQLLNVAERFFLIDCGEGTQMQLRRYKAKFQAIDHILISHLHGDHFFGLPGLLSSMHLLGRKQSITIYGPPDLKDFIEQLNKISETRLNYEIKWVFTSNQGLNLIFEDDKVEVFSFPLKHRIACTGFLFREKPRPRKIDTYKLEKYGLSRADILLLKKGRDVVNNEGQLISNADITLDPPPPKAYAYCSDTVFSPETAEYVKGVNLLYHESTFLDDQLERAKKTFHSTAKQAAQFAKLAEVQTLLMGHFSARYRELGNFLDDARPIFENSLLATDGKIINI